MRNLKFNSIVLCLIFLSNLNAQNCSVENCIQATFETTHVNWWKVSNAIDGIEIDDSFFLVEGKMGDSSFTNFNGSVSVLKTSKMNVLMELDELVVYILPAEQQTPGKNVKSKNSGQQLQIDMGEHVYLLDSFAQDVYITDYNDGKMKVKINRQSCSIEWIEVIMAETEQTEDKGFLFDRAVTRTIRYMLISSEKNPVKVTAFIAQNTLIEMNGEKAIAKSGYNGFEINNLLIEEN
ncbi:MAG TPA: hypothetical protein VGF79_06095 [Bacteroidia bacterium]